MRLLYIVLVIVTMLLASTNAAAVTMDARTEEQTSLLKAVSETKKRSLPNDR